MPNNNGPTRRPQVPALSGGRSSPIGTGRTMLQMLVKQRSHVAKWPIRARSFFIILTKQSHPSPYRNPQPGALRVQEPKRPSLRSLRVAHHTCQSHNPLRNPGSSFVALKNLTHILACMHCQICHWPTDLPFQPERVSGQGRTSYTHHTAPTSAYPTYPQIPSGYIAAAESRSCPLD